MNSSLLKEALVHSVPSVGWKVEEDNSQHLALLLCLIVPFLHIRLRQLEQHECSHRPAQRGTKIWIGVGNIRRPRKETAVCGVSNHGKSPDLVDGMRFIVDEFLNVGVFVVVLFEWCSFIGIGGVLLHRFEEPSEAGEATERVRRCKKHQIHCQGSPEEGFDR